MNVVPILSKSMKPVKCSKCGGPLTVVAEGFKVKLACYSEDKPVCLTCARNMIDGVNLELDKIDKDAEVIDAEFQPADAHLLAQ